MNKVLLALIALSMGVQASATTYVVPAGSSAAAIQAIVNTAGNAAGNTVVFSAGSYRLTAEVGLPCFYGTVYTGPNVGIVTQTNLPTAILTNTVPTNFVLGVLGNGTNFTGNQGCTIQYLRFSGTQGGIIVYDPASGIVIQENAFDNNNPPAGGATSEPNIWLDGTNAGFTAATGVQHITVVWNTFFNNCAAIRGSASPDSGGRCAATWVNGYNNYLTWSDNTVNLTEEGLKLSQQSAFGIASINADVENNNMQGNSRIMIESQMDTNGAGIYSHNAFYQPFNPSYNTFELSLPQYTPSISPTHVISDDVFIGNVPVTFGGAGGHYGIGLELWGAGSIATYNLFQGGNGPPTCPAGGWCSGWQICLGGTFTNGTVINNYFSGNDVWTGTPNDMHNSLTYEESAASSNAGLIQTPNTVVQNSTTIPVAAPVIQATAGSGGSTITLSDSDTNHRLTIFYTTDGSTPTSFRPGSTAGTSKVYAAPFTIPAGTTVKAIASWGQGANQGIVFPSFGYVPSSVTALGVTPAAIAGKTMTSAYLHSTANTMVTGSTLQFTAYGVYSDGSVSKLPNTAVAWGASNHKVAVISMGGHVTAMGTGVVNVQATVGTLKASYWTVTVRPTAQPSAVQPAASAARPAAPVAAQEAEPVTAARAEASPAANEPSAPSAPAAPDAPEAAPSGASPPGPAAAAPDGSSLVASAPPPAAPGKVLPDAFQGAFWRVVTPAGGSASISTSHLYLGVPGGSNHDAMLSSNQAVRVVQAIGNQNFDVTIKIDSPLFATDANTSQGLMVSSDAQNFITFALQTDGTRVGLSAHTVTGGVATSVLQDSDFSQYQNPMYLRLTKSGSAYVALYSIDGINFTQAGSFTDTAAATAVGPF